jgi:hypothetical protein
MIALDSYYDLTEQGFNFWLEQGVLKCHAPKGKMTGDILAWLKTHKKELIFLLATKPHPQIEDGQHSPTIEATHLNFQERNAHMVKCQQCEHLSSTGQCTRKQGIKPMPDALRTCDKFNLLKGERGLIQGQNYTPSEINSLIERYEKPLFYHALDCSICNIEKARYCANGYAIGSVYDALLLVCEDTQARREDLALRIDKACISGRSVFEAFNPNVQHTLNAEPTTAKYGHSAEYEAFINHWTACEVCKPNLGRYCIEGQKLKEVADNSNVAF